MDELNNYNSDEENIQGAEETFDIEEESNYRTYLYIATAVVAVAGLYVAWLYISSDKNWGYEIEWKFWNSTILWPALSFIGFFLQFIDWQHTSFKEGWIVKDSFGREKFVENNDILSVLWGSCLFPLLAHFLIIPCIYGAVLYYVVMVPLALVNAIIPYLAAILSICVAILLFFLARNYNRKSSPLVWLIGTTIVCLGLVGLLSLPTNSNFNFGSSESKSEESVLPKSIGHATVTAKVANLRTGPGTEYDCYLQTNGEKLQVTEGEQIQILEDVGEWFKILTPDNGIAYIKKTLCTEMVPELIDEDDPGCETEENNDNEENVDSQDDISEDNTEQSLQSFDEQQLESENEQVTLSSEVETTNESNSEILNTAEQMPSFPGGGRAMMEYLSNNIHYPSVAEENGLQGRVITSFVVEKDGSLSNIRIERSIDPSLDKEAIRVIKNMPRWIPGRQNGETVRVKYTVPVTFRLQ